MFADALAQQVLKTRSVVCVGLDPRWESLPVAIRGVSTSTPSHEVIADQFRRFCCEIIDVVRDRVPTVKPQAAFFEQLGAIGMVALEQVVRYASSAGLLVIMDAKRGDIGTTATGYAQAYLGRGEKSPWGCDALTVNPYLGLDAIEPFAECCDARDAGIFVLVKTSNPGSGMLQDRVTDGMTIYRKVADVVRELNQSRLGSSGYGSIGAVVGATYPQQLVELRSAMPTSWILVPGFGAQGGNAADVAGAFDNRGLGAIVNNSRNLIFAHARPEYKASCGEKNWQRAVELATIEMNQSLSEVITLT
jgi:orotidine-5'-phosphate decarboxylase